MKKNALTGLLGAALLIALAAWTLPAGAGGGAHADHAPRHGGVLMMNGDLHYEVVVDFKGKFAIYFSDAHRKPIDSDRVAEASIAVLDGEEEREQIVLRADRGGAWSGTGAAIDLGAITVRVRYLMKSDARSYAIDMEIDRPASLHGRSQ